MQRKGNAINRKNQAENQETFGIDMGGTLWATAIRDWESGKNSYYGLKDTPEVTKEERLFQLVSEHVRNGKKVDVYYEAGRYGFWPARKMLAIGVAVHILPINKLKVIMCGKTIKTDKLDAKFLGGLHPSDEVPEVYIPTLTEEGRRDAERELDRIKASINRVNAQMLALIDRTPLPTPDFHRTSAEWSNAVLKWSKMTEWNECPKLLLLRLPNMISELELFEKELTDWQKVIEQYQDSDRDNSNQSEVEDRTSETVMKLQQFKGVGERLSRHLPWEIGDFRRFGSGKQFAAFFGLTPCPFASGTMNREQGISKAGRKSLRKMAVECAWLWYRWQPDSWLVKKWQDRLVQKGRIRRTAIVALARQLMVALWRYIVKGEAIEGAIINKPIEI